VEEYNKMIDALALSSEKLAQSEREMAWREMAKQVAHEIKNPLTPMKLSVQYLMRTFENKDPNWEEKLQSLSKTLIEQIDTLSNIATAFSDFANMPKSMKEKHEINAIIETAVDLYSNHDNVKLTFTSSETFKVNVDKNQWIRVFNNLIKNSIQAMPDDHNLEIEISLERQDSAVQIRFSDNGKGIPEAMQEMIFVPKFTTKTTGAGLGLAMVKNIVTNSEGSIRFESVANKGTTFYIQLPLKD
jgi:nitrogen fixation/metabolism regulation signal transduction histidine kinase